jgi:hypothetical protein
MPSALTHNSGDLPDFRFPLERTEAKVIGGNTARESTVVELPIAGRPGFLDDGRRHRWCSSVAGAQLSDRQKDGCSLIPAMALGALQIGGP